MIAPELLIFDQMPESVALYDGEGRFLYVNPAMLTRMGTTLADVRGRRVWELYPDAHDNEFSRTLRNVLETGKAASLEYAEAFRVMKLVREEGPPAADADA